METTVINAIEYRDLPLDWLHVPHQPTQELRRKCDAPTPVLWPR